MSVSVRSLQLHQRKQSKSIKYSSSQSKLPHHYEKSHAIWEWITQCYLPPGNGDFPASRNSINILSTPEICKAELTYPIRYWRSDQIVSMYFHLNTSNGKHCCSRRIYTDNTNSNKTVEMYTGCGNNYCTSAIFCLHHINPNSNWLKSLQISIL